MYATSKLPDGTACSWCAKANRSVKVRKVPGCPKGCCWQDKVMCAPCADKLTEGNGQP